MSREAKSRTQQLAGLIQNPALGAYEIWHFVKGFEEGHGSSSLYLSYLYLVCPFVKDDELCTCILKTRKGIWRFRTNLEKRNNASNLLSFQESVRQMMPYSQDAIALAVSSGLIELDCDGVFHHRTPRGVGSLEGKLVGQLDGRRGKAAERLGKYLSPLSPYEITCALGVRL